ncbi:uncharacterized protein METZ01_LOCUS242572 [marine metagenome]|uniref:Uncharacterized protein n=1 Tax=marine metagenome TaxID=408172 RepID=A0A382HQY4_9ZZZZ
MQKSTYMAALDAKHSIISRPFLIGAVQNNWIACVWSPAKVEVLPAIAL